MYNNGFKYKWMNVNTISKEEIKRIEEEHYLDKLKEYQLNRRENR